MQGFKSRLGVLNTEKSKLNSDLVEHQNQIKTLTAERDALKNTSSNESSKELVQQVDTLRREKAALEKAFADEKAAKNSTTSENSTEQASIIVRYRTFYIALAYRTSSRLLFGKNEINYSLRKQSVIQVLLV
jgi:peptidoglycan hydrolase CwlO-like protein